MTFKIRLVVGTRESREGFTANTATGRSLGLYKYPFVELLLFAQNSKGLSIIYNEAIEESRSDPAILVFLHDDLHICDFFWPWHIANTLTQFHLVGLAGNRRRVPRQPGWRFIDDSLTSDTAENLSGIVGHGTAFPPAILTTLGNPYQEVKLLDGLLLGAHSSTFIDSGLRFDERFDFHFYDLDLCRQAEQMNIRMGTGSISVIHESHGDFRSDSWRRAYREYLQKWGS